MDEFNERLSKHDLSETQLSLIRDIRRRGKNKVNYNLMRFDLIVIFFLISFNSYVKVAAQNCRKRKLDQITSLADEVRDVRTRKQRLLRERNMLLEQRQRAKEHFAALYRHVFQVKLYLICINCIMSHKIRSKYNCKLDFQHLRDADGNPLSSQQYSLQQAADGAVVVVPRSSASLLPDPRSPRTGIFRIINFYSIFDLIIDNAKIESRF